MLNERLIDALFITQSSSQLRTSGNNTICHPNPSTRYHKFRYRNNFTAIRITHERFQREVFRLVDMTADADEYLKNLHEIACSFFNRKNVLLLFIIFIRNKMSSIEKRNFWLLNSPRTLN